jgi:hypothetical protein
MRQFEHSSSDISYWKTQLHKLEQTAVQITAAARVI